MQDLERDPVHRLNLHSSSEIDSNKRGSPSREIDMVHVRRVVAGNPNTPGQVLERLASDMLPLIRRSVAANPKSPVSVLHRLAEDEHADVRIAVAENANTPPELLSCLAGDEDVDVRYGVAENPHMPEEILLALSQDENPYVRARALKTWQMLPPEAQTRLRMLLQHNPGGIEKTHGVSFY